MREQVSGLSVDSYDIHLDLRDPVVECFGSRATVQFSCDQPKIFLDLAARSVNSVTLNDQPVSVAYAWDGATLRLTGLASVNVVEIDAMFPYAIEGRRERSE